MGQERDTFWQLERINRRRTVELVMVFILIYYLIGAAFDFIFHTFRVVNYQPIGLPVFTIAAVVIAAAQALRAYYSGASLLIGAVGGHELTPDSVKTRVVADIVEEMALAARMPRPRLYLMEDPAPNAFASGRDPAHSVICVTRGLVDQLDREELQGVIAHEMAHIRGQDTRLAQMAAVMVGGFALLAGSIWHTGQPRRRRQAAPEFGLTGIVIFIVSGIGWLLARAAAIALSRQREYLADAAAVEFTRNPLALIRALQHIARIELPLNPALRAMAPLFIVDPFECGAGSWEEYLDEVAQIESQPGKSKVQRDAEVMQYMAKGTPRSLFHTMLASHPPIHDRIARLRPLTAAPPESEAEIRARRRAAAQTINEITAASPETMAAMLEETLQAKLGQQAMPSVEGSAEVHSINPQALGESNLDANPFEPASTAETTDPTQSEGELAIGMAPAHKEFSASKPVSDAATSGTLSYMFWIVIAVCAGAVAAALAVR